MSKRLIVVLSDGETWTEINGCRILEVDEDMLDSGDKPDDMNPSAAWDIVKSKGEPLVIPQ